MPLRVTPTPTWTRRHWLVPAIGWLVAFIYAAGLRIACYVVHVQDPPIYIVAGTGALAFAFGTIAARFALFGKR